MSRIKIEDLPVLEDLRANEIKGIFGGLSSFKPSEDTNYLREIKWDTGLRDDESTLKGGDDLTGKYEGLSVDGALVDSCWN